LVFMCSASFFVLFSIAGFFDCWGCEVGRIWVPVSQAEQSWEVVVHQMDRELYHSKEVLGL
jgi:hypothetical protein